jgi:hypothetical protein
MRLYENNSTCIAKLLLAVEKIIELLNGKFTNPEFEEPKLKTF